MAGEMRVAVVGANGQWGSDSMLRFFAVSRFARHPDLYLEIGYTCKTEILKPARTPMENIYAAQDMHRDVSLQ